MFFADFRDYIDFCTFYCLLRRNRGEEKKKEERVFLFLFVCGCQRWQVGQTENYAEGVGEFRAEFFACDPKLYRILQAGANGKLCRKAASRRVR